MNNIQGLKTMRNLIILGMIIAMMIAGSIATQAQTREVKIELQADLDKIKLPKKRLVPS